MRVAITGATGVIGSALVEELRSRGDEPVALSRDASGAKGRLGVAAYEWKAPKSAPPPSEALRGSQAVVNLLGETIAQRWSDEAKREIRDSRVLGTRNLVAGLAELPESERPRVLVSQSASGWYGARG
jgi:NAD dependent epimerase/dehydratase family enzyme